MLRDARTYLWDIHQAADAIMKFIAGLDAVAYSQNELVHAAVERKFEIIGEALSKLSRLSPDLAGRIPDIGDAIAFRNILIHGYAVVEHDRVWWIAHNSLPVLRAAVAALLDELGPLDT
jgi:uncharacterized protein with HEPN domain